MIMEVTNVFGGWAEATNKSKDMQQSNFTTIIKVNTGIESSL